MGNSVTTTPDPIEETLNAIHAPKSVKADLWDAYYNSANADELAEKIKPILIDKVIKARLWDMKENEGTLSPAAYGQVAQGGEEKPGFGSRFLESYGVTPETVGQKPSLKSGLLNAATLGIPQAAETLAGYGSQLAEAIGSSQQQAEEAAQNISSGAPVMSQAGKVLSGITEGTVKAIPFIGPSIYKAGEDIFHGNIGAAAGGLTGVVSQLELARAGGAESKTKVKPPEPSVAYEQMGLGLQQVARGVEKAWRDEVGAHAQNIENVMAERYPNGVIDKSPYLPLLNKTIDKYYDTMTRVGLKVPSDLKQFVDEIKQTPSDKLTWNQAKDLRSSLQDMRQMTDSRAFASALKPEIDKLTTDMANAAKQEGLGTDWEAYNTVYARGRRLGEAVLDKVIDAKTGKDALNALKSQEGAVKMALPDLKAYGLNPEEFRSALDSYKPKAEDKVQRGLLKHWWSRHAAGAIASAVGGSFMLGYGPVVAYQALTEGAGTPKLNIGSPVMKIGAQAAEARRIPGPTPVAEPVPLPEPPPTSPPKVLPPAAPRQAPKQVTVEATQVETPEPPQPSKYAEAKKAALDVARVDYVLKKIKKGQELTDDELAWMERRTGLDLTKAENVPAAINILRGKEK